MATEHGGTQHDIMTLSKDAHHWLNYSLVAPLHCLLILRPQRLRLTEISTPIAQRESEQATAFCAACALHGHSVVVGAWLPDGNNQIFRL